MTAIDRTAYPRLDARLTPSELAARHELTAAELDFVRSHARGPAGRLILAALLKTRQDLGYFPPPDAFPDPLLAVLAGQLGIEPATTDTAGQRGAKSLYRYHAAVRSHLRARPYDPAAESKITGVILGAARTMSDPADLINRAIETLRGEMTDLPAFSTLDRLAGHLRARVHGRIFGTVASRLTSEQTAALDALLVRPAAAATTGFNRMKQTPGPATHSALRAWTDRLNWLLALPDTEPLLADVAHTKLRQFASEAAVLEVSDMLRISEPGKRDTLLLALIRQSMMRCRDELTEMMLRRILKTRAAAKQKLEDLKNQHRGIEEGLIGVLHQVLRTDTAEQTDESFGREVRRVFSEQGGSAELTARCDTVTAWHGGNDLPFLWPIHARHRSMLLGLLDLLNIQPSTRDHTLSRAIEVVRAHRHTHANELADTLNLGFAQRRWRDFVRRRRDGRTYLDRRALEVCVFSHIADGLRSGDLHVPGTEAYGDYRAQLLPWSECEPKLAAWCAAVGIPRRGADFAAMLRDELAAAAAEADRGFPGNDELMLDADGTPRLRKLAPASPPKDLAEFEREVRARMPERHLLDILKYAEHWTGYTRHFGPPSGSDPKITSAVQRYLFTVFGYGCYLGPVQTARHAPDLVTPQTLRRLNAQHIDAGKLEAAMTDVINQYARFDLPRNWGSGRAAIADGTHVKLRENNLLGSRHIRYGGYGGIAYHHISDTYIALFTSFITCGVWEAVHILDALIKNISKIQPDILHADTHGQSEPVFGLCRLLAIELMPRMRGISDAVFYRPGRSFRYQHIDALFTGTIDWDLIAAHADDMFQVALSIQAGRVMPSMLLRKLGTYAGENQLYRAFRELGRVQRTLFLLRLISTPGVRRTIRAETTKIEAYNDFLDWITFGGPVVKSGDPVEQEKQLKYASLVANTIMLSNVADLSDVLAGMTRDGLPVTPALAACTSPYIRGHIRRFGRYSLDMADVPPPLNPGPVPGLEGL